MRNFEGRYFLIPIIVCLFFIVKTVVLNAQPNLPTTPGEAPIDGGLGLLALGGGAYALSKLRGKSKNHPGGREADTD